MLTIKYEQDGEPIDDWSVRKWAKHILDDAHDGDVYSVSTSPPINAIRLELLKGHPKWNFSNVQFMYEGEILRMNEYCTIQTWPPGFCDVELDLLTELLDLEAKKYERSKPKPTKPASDGRKIY